MAQSITWGFGASGTYGFGSTAVRDRYFPFKHSDFFEDDFIANYWVPLFVDGTIKNGECEGNENETRCKTPRWWTLLLLLPLKWPIVILILFSLAVGGKYYIFPGPINVVRFEDYSKSVCDPSNNRRLYIEERYDTYHFSGFLHRYTPEARIEKAMGMDVTLYDLNQNTLLRPTEKSCLPNAPCDEDKYRWNNAAEVVDNRAKLKWVWKQDPNGNPPAKAEGTGYKAAYHISSFEYKVMLPEGVTFTDWKVDTPRRKINEVSAPDCHERPVGEGELRIICSNLGGLGHEEDLIIRYSLSGWDSCETSQSKNPYPAETWLHPAEIW